MNSTRDRFASKFEGIATRRPLERFYVDAMHKPSNGFDGPTQVDYWRVMDRQTGMRADGTAKYQTPELARERADSLNAGALS